MTKEELIEACKGLGDWGFRDEDSQEFVRFVPLQQVIELLEQAEL